MFTTIIFDLDGTLMNTIGGIGNAANKVLRKHGFPEHSINAYMDFVGNGLGMTIFRALPEGERENVFKELGSEKRKYSGKVLGELEFTNGRMITYIEEIKAFYKANPLEDTAMYEGIPELLKFCKEKGITWGIHTNKTKEIAKKIVDFYFEPKDYIGLSGPDKKTPRKPEIEGSLQLVGQDYSQENILFVGDTEVDIQTAKNLSVSCALVTWGFRKREFLASLNPEFLIDRPADLINILKSEDKR